MSNIANKLRMAEAAFAAAKFTTSTGFARSDCPFCLIRLGKQDRGACFSVHVKSGDFRCWRCSIRGFLSREALGNPEGAIDESDAPLPAIEQPEGFYLMGKGHPGWDAESTEPARDYLRKRGVPEQVWSDAKIGCCLSGRFQDRIVVPVLTADDEWVGYVGRSWQKTKKKYLNATGMESGEHLYNTGALSVYTDEPVLVMEGVFDALAYWPDAVAVLGKAKEAQFWKLIQSCRPVVVVLDGDAWEEGEMLAWRLKFEGQRAGHVRLPPTKDPDEVDRDWLRQEARNAVNAQG